MSRQRETYPAKFNPKNKTSFYQNKLKTLRSEEAARKKIAHDEWKAKRAKAAKRDFKALQKSGN